MRPFLLTPRTVLVPVPWVLPQAGTNGYVSSWGAALAGVAPGLSAA